MIKLLKIIGILIIWVISISAYFNSPRTIDYALIFLFIFICSLLFLVSKFSKKFKIEKQEYIYLGLFIFAIIAFIFGFIIEANNLESNKKFVEFGLIDFIFPISIIILASLPATYLIWNYKFKR